MVTVVDLLNTALTRIKYPTLIGNIFEGTPAARAALTFYTQTRDNLFGTSDWDFLRREVSLGLPIKTAPPGGYGITPWNPVANPPIPWWYEYTYPDACIQIRSLRPVPIFIPEFTPMFTRFVAAYDTVLNTKVVLTNLYQPQAIMTGQINDPDEWRDSNFTETLIDALATQFQKTFGPDLNAVQLAERDEQQSMAVAESRRG